MWIYAFLMIFLLGALVYEQQTCSIYSPKTRGGFAFFVVLLVGLIVGVRDMVGGKDVYAYAAIFENLAGEQEFLWKMFFSLGTEGRVYGAEPGWVLYNLLIGFFTDNTYVLFFITAMISYLALFRHLRKYAPYFFFALLIIFCRQFLQSFIYVRQFLACMLVWFALDFAIKRSLIPFLLVILCAMNIHISGLIFIFVYPISRCKLPWWVMAGGFSVALALGLTPAFSSLLDTFGSLVENEKAMGYAEEAFVGGVHIFYLAEGLLIAGAVLISREKIYAAHVPQSRVLPAELTPQEIENRNTRLVALFNITFLYVCASLTTLQSPGCMRLIWVFWIGPICMLPYIMEKLVVGIGRPFFKFLIILYFIVAFWLFAVRFDYGDLLNYKTFLF